MSAHVLLICNQLLLTILPLALSWIPVNVPKLATFGPPGKCHLNGVYHWYADAGLTLPLVIVAICY